MYETYQRHFSKSTKKIECCCHTDRLNTDHQRRDSSAFFKSQANPLSANPTKWPNTLKQFVGNL